jgi:hypothetical protein
VVVVLFVDEASGQLSSMVVVHEHDDGHLLTGSLFGLFADEPVADQIANGLAPGGIPFVRDTAIKRLE